MEILALWFLGAAIGGIIGNRADSILCRTIQPLCERYMQGGAATRDLQGAVRKACLQAAMIVCDASLKEFGVTQKVPYQILSKFTQKPSSPADVIEIQWLRRVREALNMELKQGLHLSSKTFSDEVQAQIALLLQPIGLTCDQRADGLSTLMKEEMLKELESIGASTPATPLGLLGKIQPPARFIEMMQDGWEEQASGRQPAHMDWFEIVCALFAHEVKLNEKLRSLLENHLLVQMTVGEKDLPFSLVQAKFEELGFEMVRRLSKLDDYLKQFSNDQAIAFDSIHKRLDELIPPLTLLPDIWKGQEAIHQISRVLLRESLYTNYERYAGAETANRVDQILRDSTSLFVGRERETHLLDGFIKTNLNGTFLILAKAGFGKTALLSNWILQGQQADYFVIYHFFSNKYKDTTYTIAHCLRNLLRQLYIYYGLADQRLPEDEGTLRDVINGLLREKGANPGESLIIVIDGLDEAEHLFFPPFPSPLPDNVFIIVSARAEENEEPEYLQGWMENSQSLYFERLDRDAIALWLGQAGSGELAPFMLDEDFITLVEEKTEGFPLYLHYLMEEFVYGKIDVREVLQHTPQGFQKYVEQQFHQLAHVEEIHHEPKIQTLFALLAVAFGELTKKDAQAITRLNIFDLENLPWQITRWLMISVQENKTTYTFAHPLLAEEFKQVLEHQADEAKLLLLDYCSEWQKHKSLYALQYYPEHLKEAKKYDELYALAENEDFRQEQEKAFPDHPELPLRTVKTALKGVAEADNVMAMIGLLHRHVSLASKVGSEETPLEAIRNGNIEKALKLADNYEDPVPITWKLLVVHDLARNGRSEEAIPIFREISIGTKKISSWHADGIIMILSRMEGFEDSLILSAAEKLLSDYKMRELVLSFISSKMENSLSLAVRLLPLIKDTQEREKAIGSAASELARHGRWEEAFQQIEQIADAWSRAWSWSDLITVALAQKDLALAYKIAWEIEVLLDDSYQSEGFLDLNWQFAKSLAKIAIYLSPADKNKALSILSQIKALAEKTKRDTFKSRVLAELGNAYILIGEPEAAREVLEEAIHITSMFNYPREAVRSYAYISRIFSDGSMRTRALEIFEKAVSATEHIYDERIRDELLEELARDYAYEDELKKAINIATRIHIRGLKDQTLAEIAKIMVEKGKKDEAFDLTQSKPYWLAAKLLSKIAFSLMNQGAITEAEETLCKALKKMRIFFSNKPSMPVIQALANLAVVYLKKGREDKALELIDFAKDKAAITANPVKRAWHMIDIAKTIGSEGYLPDTVSELLKAGYMANKQVNREIDRVWTLSALSMYTYKYSSRTMAEEMLREAEAIANATNDAIEKARCLCEIGEALQAIEKFDQARAILSRAEDTAFGIKLFHLKRTALSNVSLTYAKLNYIAETKRLLNIRGVAGRQDAREAKVIVLTLEGKTDEAIQDARQIRDIRAQARAFRHICMNEIKKGQFRSAMHIIRLMVSNRDTESDPVEIPRLMRAFIEAGEIDCFKSLLVHNVSRTGSMYIIIGLLARIYPQHVNEIETALMETLNNQVFPETASRVKSW